MKRFNKQKTIDKIVDDFAECYMSSYWFPHSETQIEWSKNQEVYLILYNQTKTFDYAIPKHLYLYVEDLQDQDLKEYWRRSNYYEH
jgi:hypothetical protein